MDNNPQKIIIDLIRNHYHAVIKGDTEKQIKLRGEISNILKGMSENNEDRETISSLESFIEEADELTNFYEGLRPIAAQNSRISELENKFNPLNPSSPLREQSKKAEQARQEINERIESLRENADSKVDTLSVSTNEKIEAIEKELSPISTLYKKIGYISAALSIVLAVIGYNFIESITDIKDSAIKDFGKKTEESINIIDTELKYRISSSEIVKSAQKAIESQFSERFWQGSYGEMIDNTYQAISHINDRRAKNDYTGLKPTRMDEAVLVLYAYAEQLHNYSSFSIHSQPDFLEAINCKKEDFLFSHKLVSRALEHWGRGYQEVALRDIQRAYLRCKIVEAPIIDFILQGSSALKQLDASKLIISEESQIQKSYEPYKKIPLVVKPILFNYYSFAFPLATRKVNGKNFDEKILNFKRTAQVSNEKWRAISDFYEFSLGPLIKEEPKPDKKIFQASKEVLYSWPNFIKSRNQILTAVSQQPDFLEQKDIGFGALEYIFLFNEMFSVYIGTNDIELLDSLARAAKVLVKKSNNKSLSLDAEQKESLIVSAKTVVTKLCKSESLLRAYDNIPPLQRSAYIAPATHVNELIGLFKEEDPAFRNLEAYRLFQSLDHIQTSKHLQITKDLNALVNVEKISSNETIRALEALRKECKTNWAQYFDKETDKKIVIEGKPNKTSGSHAQLTETQYRARILAVVQGEHHEN